MQREDLVRDIVFEALKNLNDELAEDDKIEITVDTCLFGVDATLDSLSLVSVIVDVEIGIATELGISVALTDDRAMNQEVSPFSDVRALTNYINLLLAEMSGE